MFVRPRHGFLAGAILLSSFSSCSCQGKPDPPGPDHPPVSASARNLVLPDGVTQLLSLSQGWSDEESNAFYNQPQGSLLFPAIWFLHLERADSQQAFADEEHLEALGYLPRTPDAGNPHGLPVGFVVQPNSGDGEPLLGMTCAACHTGVVQHEDVAYLVDGAPTLADVETFLKRLTAALAATLADEAKFARFADAVLAAGSTDDQKAALRTRAEGILALREGYDGRNMPEDDAQAFGNGRVDAFGAILNEITVRFMEVPANHRPADAPVSYPFLWDTPQHDRVQWNGAAENSTSVLAEPLLGTAHYGALGRNAGEVLGVFGDLDLSEEHGVLGGYTSSVDRKGLIALEESLRGLWSPQWPFEAPDADLVTQGAELYDANCASCHAHIDRKDPERKVVASMNAVGTDEGMAKNFAERRVETGMLAGRRSSLSPLSKEIGPEVGAAVVVGHVVPRVLVGRQSEATDDVSFGGLHWLTEAEVHVDGLRLDGRFSRLGLGPDGKTLELHHAADLLAGATGDAPELHAVDWTDSGPTAGTHGGLLEKVGLSRDDHVVRLTSTDHQVRYKYKGRPLNGIWATAPYLHNGSVPNLRALLDAPADRPRTFFVGSRELDLETVGFVSDEGPFEYDTTVTGNSNAGHEYGTALTDAQKEALVAYLKTL